MATQEQVDQLCEKFDKLLCEFDVLVNEFRSLGVPPDNEDLQALKASGLSIEEIVSSIADKLES